MTGAFRRVPLTALPSRAAAELKRFLFAYELVGSGRFVIRHADPSSNSIEELEFDAKQGRYLSATERLQLRASEPSHFRMPSGQTVRLSYRVHPERNTLLAHYDVFASDHAQSVVEIEQEVYGPMQSDRIAFITKELQHARFPAEYARWGEQAKVAYWADTLHRLRRANGESGRDEDEVFTPALLQDMERTDTHVRGLLPRILRRLAALDQVDPRQLEARFMQRVGLRGQRP